MTSLLGMMQTSATNRNLAWIILAGTVGYSLSKITKE